MTDPSTSSSGVMSCASPHPPAIRGYPQPRARPASRIPMRYIHLLLAAVKRFSLLLEPHLPNKAAKGRASNTARRAAILPPLTWYHSAMKAVPAGVLVTMSEELSFFANRPDQEEI